MKQDPIAEALASRGSETISQFARMLGVDYHALKQRYDFNEAAPFKTARGPEPEDIQILGKPGMQRFVIAVKRAGQGWPEKYADVIATARRKFDAGTHEMFQSSNEGWVIQYLWPRLVPTERRCFFSEIR